MAHVAQINDDNKVINVIVVSNDVADPENFAKDLFGGKWVQTSYNGKFRGTFAGIGFDYNEEEDIFIRPKPFNSWIRNGSIWEAPISKPNDDKKYEWNEELGNWVEIQIE